MDKSGKIIDVNNDFCTSLGFTKEEIIGSILQDSSFLTYDSRKKAMYRQIARLIGKEKPSYNLDIKTKNGNILSFDIETEPYIQNGLHVGEINIIRKIRTSSQSEQKIDSSETQPVAKSSDLLNVLEKARNKSHEIKKMQNELDKKEHSMKNMQRLLV